MGIRFLELVSFLHIKVRGEFNCGRFLEMSSHDANIRELVVRLEPNLRAGRATSRLFDGVRILHIGYVPYKTGGK